MNPRDQRRPSIKRACRSKEQSPRATTSELRETSHHHKKDRSEPIEDEESDREESQSIVKISTPADPVYGGLEGVGGGTLV
ncbi:hypothetical protein VULLAG_LOCUS2729 [Vulpes lagopus]